MSTPTFATKIPLLNDKDQPRTSPQKTLQVTQAYRLLRQVVFVFNFRVANGKIRKTK